MMLVSQHKSNLQKITQIRAFLVSQVYPIPIHWTPEARLFCRRHRNWKDATGEWVHVTITTVFGQSMEVRMDMVTYGKAYQLCNFSFRQAGQTPQVALAVLALPAYTAAANSNPRCSP